MSAKDVPGSQTSAPGTLAPLGALSGEETAHAATAQDGSSEPASTSQTIAEEETPSAGPELGLVPYWFTGLPVISTIVGVITGWKNRNKKEDEDADQDDAKE